MACRFVRAYTKRLTSSRVVVNNFAYLHCYTVRVLLSHLTQSSCISEREAAWHVVVGCHVGLVSYEVKGEKGGGGKQT